VWETTNTGSIREQAAKWAIRTFRQDNINEELRQIIIRKRYSKTIRLSGINSNKATLSENLSMPSTSKPSSQNDGAPSKGSLTANGSSAIAFH
jgi:hypothetical protein